MIDIQKRDGLQLIKEIVSDDKTLSRIYGFILYTDANPYVAKVLGDDSFWAALNEISGSNWPIFAVRPLKQGTYGFPHGDSKERVCYMMVPVWNEPKDNLRVLEDFGVKSSRELPLFVAFMWDDNDRFHKVAVPIRGEDTDSVYHYLEKIVKVVSDTESTVEQEFKNSENVFRNVAEQLQSLDARTEFVNNFKIFKGLYDFISMFKFW